MLTDIVAIFKVKHIRLKRKRKVSNEEFSTAKQTDLYAYVHLLTFDQTLAKWIIKVQTLATLACCKKTQKDWRKLKKSFYFYKT